MVREVERAWNSIYASFEKASVIFLSKCKTVCLNAWTHGENGNKSWHQLVLFHTDSVAVSFRGQDIQPKSDFQSKQTGKLCSYCPYITERTSVTVSPVESLLKWGIPSVFILSAAVSFLLRAPQRIQEESSGHLKAPSFGARAGVPLLSIITLSVLWRLIYSIVEQNSKLAVNGRQNPITYNYHRCLERFSPGVTAHAHTTEHCSLSGAEHLLRVGSHACRFYCTWVYVAPPGSD